MAVQNTDIVRGIISDPENIPLYNAVQTGISLTKVVEITYSSLDELVLYKVESEGKLTEVPITPSNTDGFKLLAGRSSAADPQGLYDRVGVYTINVFPDSGGITYEVRRRTPATQLDRSFDVAGADVAIPSGEAVDKLTRIAREYRAALDKTLQFSQLEGNTPIQPLPKISAGEQILSMEKTDDEIVPIFRPPEEFVEAIRDSLEGDEKFQGPEGRYPVFLYMAVPHMDDRSNRPTNYVGITYNGTAFGNIPDPLVFNPVLPVSIENAGIWREAGDSTWRGQEKIIDTYRIDAIYHPATDTLTAWSDPRIVDADLGPRGFSGGEWRPYFRVVDPGLVSGMSSVSPAGTLTAANNRADLLLRLRDRHPVDGPDASMIVTFLGIPPNTIPAGMAVWAIWAFIPKGEYTTTENAIQVLRPLKLTGTSADVYRPYFFLTSLNPSGRAIAVVRSSGVTTGTINGNQGAASPLDVTLDVTTEDGTTVTEISSPFRAQLPPDYLPETDDVWAVIATIPRGSYTNGSSVAVTPVFKVTSRDGTDGTDGTDSLEFFQAFPKDDVITLEGSVPADRRVTYNANTDAIGVDYLINGVIPPSAKQPFTFITPSYDKETHTLWKVVVNTVKNDLADGDRVPPQGIYQASGPSGTDGGVGPPGPGLEELLANRRSNFIFDQLVEVNPDPVINQAFPANTFVPFTLVEKTRVNGLLVPGKKFFAHYYGKVDINEITDDRTVWTAELEVVHHVHSSAAPNVGDTPVYSFTHKRDVPFPIGRNAVELSIPMSCFNSLSILGVGTEYTRTGETTPSQLTAEDLANPNIYFEIKLNIKSGKTQLTAPPSPVPAVDITFSNLQFFFFQYRDIPAFVDAKGDPGRDATVPRTVVQFENPDTRLREGDVPQAGANNRIAGGLPVAPAGEALANAVARYGSDGGLPGGVGLVRLGLMSGIPTADGNFGTINAIITTSSTLVIPHADLEQHDFLMLLYATPPGSDVLVKGANNKLGLDTFTLSTLEASGMSGMRFYILPSTPLKSAPIKDSDDDNTDGIYNVSVSGQGAIGTGPTATRVLRYTKTATSYSFHGLAASGHPYLLGVYALGGPQPTPDPSFSFTVNWNGVGGYLTDGQFITNADTVAAATFDFQTAVRTFITPAAGTSKNGITVKNVSSLPLSSSDSYQVYSFARIIKGIYSASPPAIFLSTDYIRVGGSEFIDEDTPDGTISGRLLPDNLVLTNITTVTTEDRIDIVAFPSTSGITFTASQVASGQVLHSYALDEQAHRFTSWGLGFSPGHTVDLANPVVLDPGSVVGPLFSRTGTEDFPLPDGVSLYGVDEHTRLPHTIALANNRTLPGDTGDHHRIVITFPWVDIQRLKSISYAVAGLPSVDFWRADNTLADEDRLFDLFQEPAKASTNWVAMAVFESRDDFDESFRGAQFNLNLKDA